MKKTGQTGPNPGRGLHSKVVVMLFVFAPLFTGVLCYAVFSVLSSFRNHLAEEEKACSLTLTVFLMSCGC